MLEEQLIIYYPSASLFGEQLMEVREAESLALFRQQTRSQNGFHQRLLSCRFAASLRRV